MTPSLAAKRGKPSRWIVLIVLLALLGLLLAGPVHHVVHHVVHTESDGSCDACCLSIASAPDAVPALGAMQFERLVAEAGEAARFETERLGLALARGPPRIG